MKSNKLSMFILKITLWTTFASIIGAESANKSVLPNCCSERYKNFTGIKCVANDFSEYLPTLNCDKYVLLAELLDDEFDDGT